MKGARAIGVIDRSNSFGFEGPLFSDVKAALYNNRINPPAVNYIAGLGGRDVTADDLDKIYRQLLDIGNTGQGNQAVEYIGLRWYE